MRRLALPPPATCLLPHCMARALRRRRSLAHRAAPRCRRERLSARVGKLEGQLAAAQERASVAERALAAVREESEEELARVRREAAVALAEARQEAASARQQTEQQSAR